MYNPHTHDFSDCPSLMEVSKTRIEFYNKYGHYPDNVYMNQRTLAKFIIEDSHLITVAPENYTVFGMQVEYHNDYDNDDVYLGMIEEEHYASETPSLDLYFFGEISSFTHVIIDRKMWCLEDIPLQTGANGDKQYRRISYRRQIPPMVTEDQLRKLSTFKIVKATLLKVGKEEE